MKIKESKAALMFTASVDKNQLMIRLWDGKQKFGVAAIQIQNGENTYLRPRLYLTVPVKEAKSVSAGSPLKLLSFSHKGDQFEVKLVANSGGGLPDVVVSN